MVDRIDNISIGEFYTSDFIKNKGLINSPSWNRLYLTKVKTDKNAQDGDVINTGATDSSSVFEIIDLSSATGGSSNPFNSIEIVQSPADLASPLSSDTLYWIDGVIDMGSTSIGVPSTGLNLHSPDPRVNKLISSEDNFTLFVAESEVAGAGGFVATGIGIEVTGTNSKVFDIDNTNNGSTDEFSMDTCDFNNCTSLGTVTGYRQGLWEVIGVINCLDGITLDGTWSGGFRATTSIVLNMPSGGTAFSAGGTLTFGNRFLTDMNFSNIQAGATAIDFSEANFINDETFIIIDATFTGAGSYLPNIDRSSTKIKISNSKGVRNSYIGGSYEVTTGAITIIPAVNTPTKMAGTTTYENLVWFSGDNDNEFVYESDQTIEVDVYATLSFDGGTGDNFRVILRQWDNSASSYIDLSSTVDGVAFVSDATSVTVIAEAQIDQNDRIEAWVENLTDGGDITTIAGGRVQVREK